MYRIGDIRNLCRISADHFRNIQVLKTWKTNFTSAAILGLLKRFHPSNRGNNKLLNIDNGNDKHIIRYKGDSAITTQCNFAGGAPCHQPWPPSPPCGDVKPRVYPKCKRVCLKYCKPLARGERIPIRLNNCKGVEYKYPSFARSANKIPLGFTWVADCCYWDECCRRVNIGSIKDTKTLVERQRKVLGFREKNVSSLSKMKPKDEKGCRRFSTSARFREKTGDGCEPKGSLSCLKIDVQALKRVPKSRKSCNRICLPCCKKCREPPICVALFIKPPCKRLRSPRPSFSECQDILPYPNKCECQSLPVKCNKGKK